MAVEQGVPIGGLQAVLERRGESGRRHRPLVADEYALGQTNTVRSVVAEQRCSPRLRNAEHGEQPLGAHQPMLKDRSEILCFREVIKAFEAADHASDR